MPEQKDYAIPGGLAPGMADLERRNPGKERSHESSAFFWRDENNGFETVETTRNESNATNVFWRNET
jgi:hypothetical protein